MHALLVGIMRVKKRYSNKNSLFLRGVFIVMKKIMFYLVAAFITVCNIAYAGVLPEVDHTPSWYELGHPSGDKSITFYVDVNPNNVIDPFGNGDCVEYNLMYVDRNRDGLIYVYQMYTNSLMGRFVKRYVVEDNEIVDDWIYVEKWHEINSNSYVVVGRDSVIPIFNKKYR